LMQLAVDRNFCCFLRENRAVKGFTRRALRALDSAIFS
jgi:hypothetical protein